MTRAPGGRHEVLCHSPLRWSGRLLARLVVRGLLTFAYSWPVPATGTGPDCERALDAIVARPVWWRGRARRLVAELLDRSHGG